MGDEGPASMARSATPERVGVLLVHGIGEQTRFQHLCDELRGVLRGLEATVGADNLTVEVASSDGGPRLAAEASWRADDEAPVRAYIRRTDQPRDLVVEFHEVWWADLDERATLGNRIRFWLWGLSQWALVGHPPGRGSVARLLTTTECPQRTSRAWVRARLFFVGMVFLLLQVTLSLIDYVLARLRLGRLPLPHHVLESYCGDVRLYVTEVWRRDPPLDDRHVPPRFAVRRRMIRKLVDVALQDYDRWYVVAHSLGTVVAYNGLSEIGLALPNYLDEARWQRCVEAGLAGRAPADEAADSRMRPERPGWLDPRDKLRREALFAGLHGFLTYGSPLDKFATMWPWIVGRNPEPAFRPGFAWVNVWDETDPVGARLDCFGDPPATAASGLQFPAPSNRRYSAHAAILLSHVKYMAWDASPGARLIDHLGGCLLDAGCDLAAEVGDEARRRAGRYASLWAQALAAAAVSAAAAAAGIDGLMQLFAGRSLLWDGGMSLPAAVVTAPVLGLAGAAAVVAVAGLVGYLGTTRRAD